MSASFGDEFSIPPPPPKPLREFTLRFDPKPVWYEAPLAALAGFALAAVCAALLLV